MTTWRKSNFSFCRCGLSSAFSTFSGYKASSAQGITSEYAADLPASEVAALTEEMLMSSADVAGVAVKFAREEANNTEVTDQHVGAAVFGYLFG